MAELDLALRGAAFGELLIVALLFWRGGTARIAAIFSLLALALTAYLLRGTPAAAAWPASLKILLLAIAFSGGFFFWVFTRQTFEEDYALSAAAWLLLGVNEAAVLLWHFVPQLHGIFAALVLRLIPLAFLLDALWRIWRDRRVDLMDERAWARTLLLLAAGGAASIKIIATFLFAPVMQWPAAARLVDSGITALLMFAACLVFGQLNPRLFAFAAPAPALPDSEAQLVSKLEQLMRQDMLWRRSGLTIGGLADKAGVPEYRLRRLLNRRLGFRNFTTYLNTYRLEAAARLLADCDSSRLPILTIAMDTGWASIGPFNRAFRAKFGMTPSQYRKAPKSEK